MAEGELLVIVPVLPLQKMLLAHIVYNKLPQSKRLEQDPSSDPNPCFSPSTIKCPKASVYSHLDLMFSSSHRLDQDSCWADISAPTSLSKQLAT